MAQRVTVASEDDLDGGPAEETVRFGIGTTEYEIDLSEKNAAKLRQRLAPFVEHARKLGKGQTRRAARTAMSRQHSAHIRAWAVGQGITISERGRIPATVVAQYEAASGAANHSPRPARHARGEGVRRQAARRQPLCSSHPTGERPIVPMTTRPLTGSLELARAR